MKLDTLKAKIERALEEYGHGDKQVMGLLPLWRESYKEASALAEKAFVRLILFGLIFTLIDTAQLTEASLFGIKFEQLGPPYVVVFVLSILMYYRFISLASFSQITEETIRDVHFRYYKKMQHEGLTDLTGYPSLMQIENAFGNLTTTKSQVLCRVANGAAIGSALICGLAPVAWITWASYALITSSLVGPAWSIPIVCVTFLIVARTLLTAAHWILLTVI